MLTNTNQATENEQNPMFETNQLVDSVIPAEIIADMVFIEDIVYGKNYSSPLLGVTVNADDTRTPWFCDGGTAIFISTDKGLFAEHKSEYGDAFDGIHDVMDCIEVYAEQLSGYTFRLTTWISGLDVENEGFDCIYDFSTSKSLPQSVYDAYAYLNAHSKLSKGVLLELFGAATCAICCRCIPYHVGDTGITVRNFDAADALSYDLKNNLPS